MRFSALQLENFQQPIVHPKYLFNQKEPIAPFKSRNAVHYAISPTVNYKIQPKTVVTDEATGAKIISPIGYVGFRNVEMGDWDWPDSIHPDTSISISKVEDVLERVKKRTRDYPSENYRLYLTPGGVRGYQIGGLPRSPEVSNRIGFFDSELRRGMGIDPNYSKISLDPNSANNALGKNLFNARITGKPERMIDGNTDFVAYHIANVGKGEINPNKLQAVKRYHDFPILRHIANQKVNVQDEVQAILDKHLGDVSPDAFVPTARSLFYS